jgi:hypothetical protein
MGITVNWDNDEKTVIRTTFDGRWTLEDFWNAVQDQYRLMDEIPYKVNFISDFRNSGMLPSGALSHARRLISTKQHVHTGPISVVVGANRFIQSFFGLLNKVYSDTARKHRIIFASTIEEGRALLATHQETPSS